MKKVIFKDLGRISYREAWDLQQTLLAELVDRKMENRQRQKRGEAPLPQHHYLLFCEHPPVYTLGRSGSEDNLLLDEARNQILISDFGLARAVENSGGSDVGSLGSRSG